MTHQKFILCRVNPLKLKINIYNGFFLMVELINFMSFERLTLSYQIDYFSLYKYFVLSFFIYYYMNTQNNSENKDNQSTSNAFDSLSETQQMTILNFMSLTNVEDTEIALKYMKKANFIMDVYKYLYNH